MLRRLHVRFFNPPGLTKCGYSHVAVVTGGKRTLLRSPDDIFDLREVAFY
jgi:hypothetical protein